MMRKIIIFAALIVMATVLPLYAEETAAPAPYKIASGIKSGVSTVAWNPKGSKLAYITKRLYISTLEGEKVKSPLRGAYFVSWLSDDSLLVLSKNKKTAYVSLLSSKGEVISQSALPVTPTAAFATYGNFEHLLLTTEDLESMRIGERTFSNLYRLDTGTGEHVEIFAYDRIHKRSMKGTKFIMGWSGAGISPLTGEIALLEYIDPPALNSYARLVTVDPITGRGAHLYRAPFSRLAYGAGWSARGDMLAVADAEGTLRIISIEGLSNMPDDTIKGTYASWSPTASRICFGGYLINPDGSGKVQLPETSEGSRCLWRPGGQDMAVLNDDGTLWIHTGMDEAASEQGFMPGTEPFDATIIDKIRVLRELLGEGLIDIEDYETRFIKVTGIRKATK